MSAPDPEGLSLLAKILAAGAAVVAPVWGAWSWLDGRMAKKADKAEVAAELTLHRQYFAKVFDKMEEHQKSDHEQFSAVINLMHEHHAETLKAMAEKADR